MFKVNAGQVAKVLFYGFSKTGKYYQNLSEGRKKTKSWICLSAIIIGTILGFLTPLVIEPKITHFVAHTMGFDPNWFFYSCAAFSFASAPFVFAVALWLLPC